MVLTAGTHLGRYEIVSFLGAGGMGEVYKARDLQLTRSVAIKVTAERFTDRFSKEARAIAALNDQHICTIYDVGPNYLVMEYIEGGSLASRIRKGRLPIKELLRLGSEIAHALAAAHSHGIIHRDLKPGNIMLTDSGAKLVDFGLASIEETLADEGRTETILTASAQIIGTAPYMSPEQLEGKRADHRSGIFALGTVLYEMASGHTAFGRESTAATIAAVTSLEPQPLKQLAKNVLEDLERIIHRCLRKDRSERYSSALEVAHQLERSLADVSKSDRGIDFRVLLRRSRRPRVAIPTLIGLLLFLAFAGWWVRRSSNVRWARTQALPEIARLVEQEKRGEAYTLALRAEKYIPDDPMLVRLWPEISWLATVRTTPAGASVFRRDYGSNRPWEFIGHSPIAKQRSPRVNSQWKLELKGFVPIERLTFSIFGMIWPSESISATLDKAAGAPPGMVHQTDSPDGPLSSTPATLFGLPGYDDLEPVPLQDYWIDRYEVTNRQFKEFIDKGGYREQRYWTNPFYKDGRKLSWAEAVALFRDTTGRPGPATWQLGDFPHGQEDYPVSGISWYEAAAYAEFAGKKLPTIYHWATAASPWGTSIILPVSNFSGRGPSRVGVSSSMSWFGAYDMARNVKEWCWNEAAAGKRFIVGGGWDEPYYMFNDPDARSPFERSANFGVRCALYTSTAGYTKAADPIVRSIRDFSSEKPVSDSVFRVYKSFYSYD